MGREVRVRPFDTRDRIGRGIKTVTIVVFSLFLSACTQGADLQPGPTPLVVPLDPEDSAAANENLATLDSPDAIRYGYTYHSPDGNRFVHGAGSLPEITPIEIEVGFTPVWVVGVPTGAGSLWVTVSSRGEVLALLVAGGQARQVSIDKDHYASGQPPLLGVNRQIVALIGAAEGNGSLLSHPVVIHDRDAIAWIDPRGRLQLQTEEGSSILEVQALADARILQDERGRLLFLSGPDETYDHGVLGDSIEAVGITLVETNPEFRIAKRITVPEGLVIEGIMPLWHDLDGDGVREIIVTASDRSSGARLLVYSETGLLIAESEAIGQGYRWRHQIAVVSPAPGEPPEVVSVRTPHIGGILEYFRLSSDRLERVATAQGVTSHVIGTRNLDLALSGDFDGDGVVEVLLPDDNRRQLVAVQRSQSGAAIEWSLPLAGTLSTNLAATTDDRGQISVAAGLENGTLWIWSP